MKYAVDFLINSVSEAADSMQLQPLPVVMVSFPTISPHNRQLAISPITADCFYALAVTIH